MEQMGAFLPLILIFGVFYLLLIRPQQKKVKLHREMINNLKRGDKIITSGGIVGTITKVNDNKELVVQISENTEVKLAPGMVSELYLTPEVVKKTNTSSNTKNIENKGLLTGIFGKSHLDYINILNNSLNHRGPDDTGVHSIQDKNISFAMKRLSIIDLENGHQPMIDSENENVIVFNGEIFNASQLRNELSKVFDGMAPSINKFNLKGQAGEQLKITTKFMIDQNTQEADALVRDKLFEGLNNMEVNYTMESQQKVGPTIADDIRDSALWSVVFSLIVIFLYILIRFKKWQFSLGAVVAVFHDVLIVLSIFSIFYGILPFSLEIDQAFIAAILTIIGYSLNDTVVVFDRVREHMINFKKKEVHELINGALNSTLSRTINTSLTTFFVLLVIFLFGGEVIKGFMFALMVGVVVGTYSSLFVASPLMMDTIKRKEIKNS